jgi:putative DNA primase/helicase
VSTRADLPSPMASAALQYARRGWPVFPCRECDGEPYQIRTGKRAGEMVTPKAKQPYVATGLKAATTDEAQILRWWRQWPNAMIGLPLGAVTRDGDGFFALDFDPRHDPATGEDFTLELLKERLEVQMGCPVPASLAVRTPSGGVHIYLRQPRDGGDEIRNRGNLPEHVDVRGRGGYVIAPPSVIVEPCADATAGRYRWLHGRVDAAVAEAPIELIEILRDRGGRRAAERATADPAASVETQRHAAPGTSLDVDDRVRDAIRKYGLAALDAELDRVRRAGSGKRNAQLNESALKIAALTVSTPIAAIDGHLARSLLEAAARENPGRDSDGQLLATLESGWSAGLNNPRDLAEVAAASIARAQRQGGSTRRRGPPPPANDGHAGAPPPRAQQAQSTAPFRFGTMEGLPRDAGGEAPPLESAELEQAKRIAQRWLERRLDLVARDAKAMTAILWGIGRRLSAGLFDEAAVRELIAHKCEAIPDLQLADIDRAFDDGFNKGYDPHRDLFELRLARYPLTDFGIGERFRDRFGADYRFTTGKGWFGWDGRRWKLLDQDEKTPPAEVVAAVFETIRLIQREADRVAATGVKRILVEREKTSFLEEEVDAAACDHWVPKGRGWELFSTKLRTFGRQSETAGKPASIALLARRWLTIPIEAFDSDPLSVNVLNGTLRFRRVQLADGMRAEVELAPHRRDDLNTKLAPFEYDPAAECPLYDGMLEWAQPDPAMRRYLHQVGGYALTGDTGEHKLWFWYGRGRNGKSTTIDAWCHVAGDYSGSTLVETFLDQGVKKRGDAATPDLARLGGVRMLRASEPERGAKLNSALIKFVTGGEPVPVRALHRGFFDLHPRFKLLISGNIKPDIPDTDDGIWGRMKLVEWGRNIDKPESGVANWPKKDPELLGKIKAREGSGVLNRLVAGLLDWLANGLVEPSAVTEATQAYRDDSDPLARFLRLCTEADPVGKVQSSHLHEVFCAWAKAAGEREWSQKGFSRAMAEKGFQKKASDGMQWLGLRLIKQVHDFVDGDGRVRAIADDPPHAPPPTDGWDELPP